MKRTLLAIALAGAAAITIPVLARSADDPDPQYAQAAPMGGQSDAESGRDEPGRRGWPMMRGMMMHRMMMHRMERNRDPQQWCMDRLARRAAHLAYVQVKLNLTAQQQPLWDKVQSAAQAEEQKEAQLCASLKAGAEPTVLDRMDRTQHFLSARLEGLQSEKPAIQALYQALTPEQQAILNRPFHRP